MIPERYNRENIDRVIEQPSLLIKEARRLASKIVYPINNMYFDWKYGKGIDIMDQDWDNLIILDACRYDYFKKVNSIEGKLRPVLSRGSHSFEFMQKNFVGEEFHDTIYITANPHAAKLYDDIFYDMKLILDHYMHPEEIVDMAVSTHESNPNKRLLIHLMPPHRPHLDPTADRLREQFDLKDWSQVDKSKNISISGRPVWNLAIYNEIPIETLHRSYCETLNIALQHAKNCINQIDGKSVITFDHGELLGERAAPLTHRRYGHPHNVYCNKLRVVPWLEIESQNRREIIAEKPIRQQNMDDSVINNRLRALGYKPEQNL